MGFDRMTHAMRRSVMQTYAEAIMVQLHIPGFAEHLTTCDAHREMMLECVVAFAEMCDEVGEAPGEQFVAWALRTFESDRLLELWRGVEPPVPDENAIPDPLDPEQLEYIRRKWGFKF